MLFTTEINRALVTESYLLIELVLQGRGLELYFMVILQTTIVEHKKTPPKFCAPVRGPFFTCSWP